MNLNKEAFKAEYVFCMYDDILRTHVPTLIRRLIELQPSYERFINYDKLLDKSMIELLRLSLVRTSYNLLVHLAKAPFDYDLTYMNIMKNIPLTYEHSPNMVMTNAIDILANSSFVKKVFIYHPCKNTQIEADVNDNIIKSKKNVEFVYGTIEDVIKSIGKVTLYIVNDIYVADTIIKTLPKNHADILVADYGYNYKLNKDRRAVLKVDNIDDILKHYGLNMFMPFYREQLEIPKV